MTYRSATLYLLLATAAGCAGPATPRSDALPTSHPANPSAEVAPPGEPSTVLVAGNPPSAVAVAAVAPPAGAAASSASAPSTQPAFACPMHPEVVSADPKARCPKCGMALKPQPDRPATGPAATAPAGHDHHAHGGH